MQNLKALTLILTLVSFLATACTRDGSSSSSANGDQAAALKTVSADGGAKQEQAMKVGLVLDKGGKDDKSFNTAAVRGATQAREELGIELKDVECQDDAAFEPALRTFAERGYPLVIAIGFAQIDAVKKVAPQFPKTNFAIVDGIVDAPNVASLMFNEHEGSYLVGYLAGLATKTGKVGFIGGMDVPLIRRFQMAYEAGAKAARPGTETLSNYVGINSSAWANPSRAKELALGQTGRGADVIFAAAGASGLGVFDAVEEKKVFAIGVDSNQNGVKPGRILSSMLKRVDTAVFETIKAAQGGSFKPGTRHFGLADKGVDYAVDEHNRQLVKPFQEKLENVRASIINGTLKVPDYYLKAQTK